MFQGIAIFAIGGLVLIAAFAVLMGRRRQYEESGSPEDRLTDEEFRRIEFGDEDI
ncbi:MAG: hypothetical protein ACKO5A_11320 [Actinomycetota bacterium]|jgi:hypothetical protein